MRKLSKEKNILHILHTLHVQDMQDMQDVFWLIRGVSVGQWVERAVGSAGVVVLPPDGLRDGLVGTLCP